MDQADENLFQTPSPGAKKTKFDLSELDEKHKPIIPIATKQTVEITVTQASAPPTQAITPDHNETEKVQKAAKVSRKKRKFAEMLGGSALV